MDVQTTTYRAPAGWSAPLPRELDGSRTLVLAFAASGYGSDTAPFKALSAAFPKALIVGCSSAGEIAGAVVDDDSVSVSVAVARFGHTDLRRATAAIESPEDSLAAGIRLGEQLDDEGLRAVFVLADGLRINGSLLVEGLTRSLPEGVVVTGGLAGDGTRFQRTGVLDREHPATGLVCAIGFYGKRLRVGHGCGGGWSDFGLERRITRAEGNVLFELDGKPALDLYKTYLGELAAGLPGTALLFPLAVKSAGGGDEQLVRTILAVDKTMTVSVFSES